MSVKLTAIVWDLKLPSHLKLVMLALADHGNSEGVCWPGQETLASRCGVSERQVRRAIKDLQERGLVRVLRRRRKQTQIYRLTLDPQLDLQTPNVEPLAEALKTGHERPISTDLGPDMSVLSQIPSRPDTDVLSTKSRPDTEGNQDRTPTSGETGHPRPVSQEPSLNHHLEPSLKAVAVHNDDDDPILTLSMTTHLPSMKATPRDPLFEALAEACNIDWTKDLTKQERGWLNSALPELRRIGATPNDVATRANNYRLELGKDPTPSAFVKWWGRVASPPRSMSNRRSKHLTATAERQRVLNDWAAEDEI